jgi:hypothetical protein
MGVKQSGAATLLGATKFGPLLFFAIFWCGLTGVFVAMLGRSLYRTWDARQRYVPVAATVLRSAVKSGSGSEGGTTYGYGIRYRYDVNGATYESDRYVFGGSRSSGGYRHAAELTRQHPVGSRLTAYVDPRNPAEAVVSRQLDPTLLFMLLFLQPFIVVGLCVAGACCVYPFSRRALGRFVEASALSYPLRVPTWGVLRLENTAGKRYVLTPRSGVLGVLLALAAGYGGACFAAIFIVGLFFGGFGQARPAAIFAAVLAALAVGITAAVGAARAAKRKPRLTLDVFNRNVTLEGPKERIVAPFSEIQSWVVGETDNPRSVKQENAPARVPLLALRRVDGAEIPVHVFADGDAAAVLAARCAEILASLSGHPADGGGAARRETATSLGSLVQAALAALKKKKDAAQRLRDLT